MCSLPIIGKYETVSQRVQRANSDMCRDNREISDESTSRETLDKNQGNDIDQPLVALTLCADYQYQGGLETGFQLNKNGLLKKLGNTVRGTDTFFSPPTYFQFVRKIVAKNAPLSLCNI